MLPLRERLNICFAHVAYRLQERFEARKAGIKSFEVRARDKLDAGIGDADVLVVSGMWRNDLIELAPKLRFIQSVSAGTDQYSREALKARGVPTPRGGRWHAMSVRNTLARS